MKKVEVTRTVLNSQKHFYRGENERRRLPTEQATADSRGRIHPGLLTCGFNYPLSHWFTVIQV